jgi:hypothetical protein
MPSEAEEVVDGALDRKKSLCLPRRFKPAPVSFSLARRLMRDFRSIVSAAFLAVVHAWQELAVSSVITPQAIGYEQTGSILQVFQQLMKKVFDRMLIPVRLDENIKHVTVLVYCPPQVITLLLNRDKDFVEIPYVAESSLAIPQLFGKGRTEF